MTNGNIKSLLILVITLVIGIAIGFEISEISIKKHFEKMDSFRKPEGFIKIFDGIIKPDNIQKAGIDSILFAYHEKIEKITHSGMDSVSKMMDSMNVELKTKLNKEQAARLDEEMQRMKKNPPPPPGKKP
ncbi:MAG: hypothetical protein P4L45_06880 [Ignavibacteriaceae bacterium]|nr:hypothetical protein [Ignavibacteriaceae bacterium]